MTEKAKKSVGKVLSLGGGATAVLIALLYGGAEVIKAQSVKVAASIRADIRQEVVAPTAAVDKQAEFMDAATADRRRLRLRLADLETEVDRLRSWIRKRRNWRGPPHHAPSVPETKPAPMRQRIDDAAARYLPQQPAPRVRRRDASP